MNILADASLPGLNQAFPEPFHITLYHHTNEIAQLLAGQDVLLCRANLKVNQSLLDKHPLCYVATASSGTDHLDYEWLATQNIQVIDAKGCNARAVADYVVSCIAYLDQQQLIHGKQAGIIGFGEVGKQVAARLHAASFQTTISDPLKGMFADLSQVDLLCIHAELHQRPPYPSMNLIDQQFLAKLKPGCVIINAARGGIVNEEALLATDFIYCTDVYLNEPEVDERIINHALLCTPHIAGHSLEAKYNAVAMVSDQLHRIMGLPKPQFAIPQMEQVLDFEPSMTWQEVALKLYNPLQETLQLKQAGNVMSTFLRVRNEHHYRHDFLLYSSAVLGEKTQLLLGHRSVMR